MSNARAADAKGAGLFESAKEPKRVAHFGSSSIIDEQRVLRIVAALLEYPDAAWRARAGEYREAIATVRDAAAAQGLAGFLDAALAAEPQAFEQRYVRAFDFGKKTSLSLAARSCTDERQQRMALLSYSMFYEEAGFSSGDELPDYLPALLELAAAVDAPQAARVMKAAEGDIELLDAALREEGLDDYAGLVELALRASGQLQHVETEQEVAA